MQGLMVVGFIVDEILRVGFKNDKVTRENCTIRVAKTKALISFAVTAKLICVFVFTYADCWFSHEAAQLLKFCNAKYYPFFPP